MTGAGKVTVTYHSPTAVNEAHNRETGSVPVRLGNRTTVNFYPEDDTTLTARCSPVQAEILVAIPGFTAEGYPVARRPEVEVRSWHEHGEEIVARSRGQIEQQAQSNPLGVLRDLLGSDGLADVLAKALAQVGGAQQPAPVAPAPVVHNIDIVEMMDLVDLDEGLEIIEEHDPAFGGATATRSAVYTRLVRLADEHPLVFERLNRRRAPVSEQ